MQEFDEHEIDTIVQLDTFEAERQSQIPRLGTPEPVAPLPPRPSTEDTQQPAYSNDDDKESQQHEPSLFDILQDGTEDELDEDLPSD